MKRRVALLMLLFLLLNTCCSRGNRYILTHDGAEVHFRSATLVQRGYIWDSRSGDVDLLTDYGTVQIDRDLSGIDHIRVEQIDQLRGDKYIELDVYFKSGRSIIGHMKLHENEGWDYIEAEEGRSAEEIPLTEIEAIYFR